MPTHVSRSPQVLLSAGSFRFRGVRAFPPPNLHPLIQRPWRRRGLWQARSRGCARARSRKKGGAQTQLRKPQRAGGEERSTRASRLRRGAGRTGAGGLAQAHWVAAAPPRAPGFPASFTSFPEVELPSRPRPRGRPRPRARPQLSAPSSGGAGLQPRWWRFCCLRPGAQSRSRERRSRLC